MSHHIINLINKLALLSSYLSKCVRNIFLSKKSDYQSTYFIGTDTNLALDAIQDDLSQVTDVRALLSSYFLTNYLKYLIQEEL